MIQMTQMIQLCHGQTMEFTMKMSKKKWQQKIFVDLKSFYTTIEQNRIEQNRTEQNRTVQNRTVQNRTEQYRTEQYRTELNTVIISHLVYFYNNFSIFYNIFNKINKL